MVHSLTLSCMAAALGLAFRAAPAQPMELAVMTFNVQQPFGTAWEGRRDNAGAILVREAPDIVGTQEAVASQREDLLARAPGFAWYGQGRDGGQAGEGCWILFRAARFRVDSAGSGNFWLSSTPATPSRFGGSYNRLCTFVRLVERDGGRAVTVFNSHFYLESESGYRQASARLLARRMADRAAEGEAVIGTGDFNSPEADAVTRWFKSGSDNPLRLRDTYRDFDPNGSVTTGFGVKYDYVYVPDSERYATVRAWVVKEPPGASDHLPTQTLLRIGDPTTRIAAAPGRVMAPRRAPPFRLDGRIAGR